MICALLALAQAKTAVLTVHCDQPTVQVSPTLYGIFFEEINCAGDGGLWSEMVRNPHFAESNKPEFWEPVAGAKLTLEKGALRVDGEGVANTGFFGMSFEKGKVYRASINADAGMGNVDVSLVDSSGREIGSARTDRHSEHHYTSYIKPSESSDKGKLLIKAKGVPSFRLLSASLSPMITWKMTGLRRDLAGMLDGLKPAFVRFPGGCWVEGDTMATSYRWKQTIGPVANRATVPNLWGYKSGNGLGFFEYLQLCENLKAEPLFVINCGMSHKENIRLDKMDEFVQDALDALEYANGPVTTRWGQERAKRGHPKPFGLKYMEIGNENGGRAYAERYPLFVKAIKARYPEVTLVANVWGGIPDTAKVEVVDEHYYSSPSFFYQNANRYDTYDRRGPKVYVGEYAVTEGCGTGNMAAALGEAAFMTGMERNSDVVVMASYAPLFANVRAKAWNPDLINFDGKSVYGTPSYYVQQMFSLNRPDHVVRSELQGAEPKTTPFPAGGVGVGTWATTAEFSDLSVTENGSVSLQSKAGEGLRTETGSFEAKEGVLAQTTMATPSRAWLGGPVAHYGTFTLRARKTGGNEGFLITVGRKDSKNYLWINLGGWGNTQHGVELCVNGGKTILKQVPGSIETGRWYDITVDYRPDHVSCWLDRKPVLDVHAPAQNDLFCAAGTRRDGETIVKIVYSGDSPRPFDVALDGFGGKDQTATRTTLSAPDLATENSLAEPKKVAPKVGSVRVRKGHIALLLPAQSVTVLSIPAGGA
ncbi:MAG: alpha-L-arabinofuranosidase [Armatimonadetes bacterium]|nr:alpha-L-arabinofuranosidase [Armatimonadota bacterium]